MNAADEILDVVDEDDRVVGRARRGDVYARGLRHRCVFVWARDAEGRVFVHRRTATKLVFPSLYDMFVGGWWARASPTTTRHCGRRRRNWG